MNQFYTILTAYGLAQDAAAQIGGPAIVPADARGLAMHIHPHGPQGCVGSVAFCVGYN